MLFPSALYAEGVRRYGFHGLSYEYIARGSAEVAPEIANGRVVVAHLGSGASMCALCGQEAWKAPWGSRRSMDCLWAHGQGSSIPASCFTS